MQGLYSISSYNEGFFWLLQIALGTFSGNYYVAGYYCYERCRSGVLGFSIKDIYLFDYDIFPT